MQHNPAHQHHHHDHVALKSISGNLALGGLTLGLSFYILDATPAWSHPALVMIAMLAMAVGNIATVIIMDELNWRLGAWTIPALFASTSTVLMVIINDAIVRFVNDIGYSWVFPAVLASMALCFAALWRERLVGMKVWLALNCIATAAMWCLAASDKVSLPF